MNEMNEINPNVVSPIGDESSSGTKQHEKPAVDTAVHLEEDIVGPNLLNLLVRCWRVVLQDAAYGHHNRSSSRSAKSSDKKATDEMASAGLHATAADFATVVTAAEWAAVIHAATLRAALSRATTTAYAVSSVTTATERLLTVLAALSPMPLPRSMFGVTWGVRGLRKVTRTQGYKPAEFTSQSYPKTPAVTGDWASKEPFFGLYETRLLGTHQL
ncbi:hypothetical protein BGZ54_003064 [Gamsiella multidivaricata]|nr:hypothetical protein BGZ54_003064 [Gamsiella multidivaricata]